MRSASVLLVFSGSWPWSRKSRSSWCVKTTKTRRSTSIACPARRPPAPCAKSSGNTRTAMWLRWTASTPGRRYEDLPKGSRFQPDFVPVSYLRLVDTRWRRPSQLSFSSICLPSSSSVLSHDGSSFPAGKSCCAELLLLGAAEVCWKVREASRRVQHLLRQQEAPGLYLLYF